MPEVDEGVVADPGVESVEDVAAGFLGGEALDAEIALDAFSLVEVFLEGGEVGGFELEGVELVGEGDEGEAEGGFGGEGGGEEGVEGEGCVGGGGGVVHEGEVFGGVVGVLGAGGEDEVSFGGVEDGGEGREILVVEFEDLGDYFLKEEVFGVLEVEVD